MIIKNPYISVEINESNLSKIYKTIAAELDKLSVPYEKTNRVHISIAYILGEHSTDVLSKRIIQILERQLKFEALGFNIVSSAYFNSDLIVLRLKKNDDFVVELENFTKENIAIKKEFNGNQFEAHITLFKIPKDFLSPEDQKTLCQWLNLVSVEIIPEINLHGESISVFNYERQLIDSFKINKIKD